MPSPNERTDELVRLKRVEDELKRLRQHVYGGGISAGVDLVWQSLEWSDTSKIDGSGPRQEVKFALLDDALLIGGIAFVDASYDGDDTLVKLPFDLTPFVSEGPVLDEGFAVTFQVNVGWAVQDLRAGFAEFRHSGAGFPVVWDDSGLYMKLECAGGIPEDSANVWINGLIRLEGKP